jgi:two-component system response regulator
MNHLNIDILLAEDSPYDAELTLMALRSRNLVNKIHHVVDGVEALDFIFGEGKYQGREPGKGLKLILLDLKMPRINGLEVLEKIKNDERTKNIPVVVLTSSNENFDIDKCYAFGVNSYIVKPVEFDVFSKVVSELGFYWMMLNKTGE